MSSEVKPVIRVVLTADGMGSADADEFQSYVDLVVLRLPEMLPRYEFEIDADKYGVGGRDRIEPDPEAGLHAKDDVREALIECWNEWCAEAREG